MLAVDSLAVWTGVMGAAVGGGFGVLGSWIQTKNTRSEGQADRSHERDMRMWQSRADRYEKVLDYAGRVVGWMEAIADGSFPSNPELGFVMWTGEEWYKMMAGLRAFGTQVVLEAFIELHAAGKALTYAIDQHSMGTGTAQQVQDACPPIHQAAVALRACVVAELHSQAP